MNKKIAIIGAGNMGQAIAQGILRKKITTQQELFLTNTKTKNNREAVQKADIIILAIKPQTARIVLEEIKSSITNQLIISIMAGIRIHTIQQTLGEKVAVIRVMPNLAAKVGQSMSVWVKSNEVTTHQESIAKAILTTIGTQLELQKEEQINIATAISGSGPAYFFYITELLSEIAKQYGFSEEIAQTLAQQTFVGSSQTLTQSDLTTKQLRLAVTSKGGTTQAAFEEFGKNNLDKIFQKGIQAAKKRAEELSK